MLLGYSTGFFYKEGFSCFEETVPITRKIGIIRDTGCNAIELSGLRQSGFSQIKEVKKEDLAGFDYVSLHAPKDQDILEALVEIDKIHERLNLDLVVFHPDVVDNWEVLDRFNLPIALENMDDRKSFGRTVEDLKPIVERHNLGVVLDINHVYTNDQTLKSLDEYYRVFGDRIKEFHVSGLHGGHGPLVVAGPVEITEAIKSIPNKNIPIIIERCCKNIKQINDEYNFVASKLQAM